MLNIKNLDTNLLTINQMTFTSTDSAVYDINREALESYKEVCSKI